MVNNELIGKIEVSDLKINIFKGIQVDDLKIYADGDIFADVKSIQIKYDILPLFKQRLILENVIIDNPKFKLIRNLSDSLWNFEKIAKPSEDTTETETPNWIIDLKKFTLNNGIVYVYDSTSIKSNSGKFNPTDLNISDLNINLNGTYNLFSSNIQSNINQFSFVENNNNLIIRNIQTDISIDTNKVSVNNFSLLTKNSGLRFSSEINNINIFGNLDSLEDKANGFISLQIDSLDNSDIGIFTNTKSNIQTKFSLVSLIEGDAKEIEVKDFRLSSEKTNINLKGKINKPLDFQNSRFSLELGDSKIDYSDLVSNLPQNIIKPIPRFSKLAIKNLTASGNTKQVDGSLEIESDLGNVKSSFALNLSENLSYTINLEANTLDLNKLSNNDISGQLNLNALIVGEGTDPKKMNSNIKLDLTDSRILDYNIRKLNLAASIQNSIINIDTLDLRLFTKGQDTLLEDNLKYSDISINGLIDIKDMKKPEYQISGKLQNLNLAQLTDNDLAPQVFTSNFHINARGIDPDSIFGSFFTEVEECLFGDRALLPFNFFVSSEIDSNEERKINIESDLMNLDISGKFNFTDFEDFILNKGIYIADYITSKVNHLAYQINDSNRRKVKSFKEGKLKLIGKIKDISPVNIFLDDAKMSLRADIALSVLSGKDSAFISLDSLNLITYRFKNPQADVNINPLKISADLELILRDSIPIINLSNVELISSTTSYINDISFEKPTAKASISNDSTKFSAVVSMNNTIKTSASGLMTIEPDRYNLTLSEGNFRLNDSFSWSLTKPLISYLDSTGFIIEELNFNREKNETINVKGKVNLNRADSLEINIVNFNFEALKKFLPKEQAELLNQISGKFEKIDALINDSLLNPNIIFDFKTSDIILNDYNIGVLSGKLFHKDAILKGLLEINSNSNKILTAKVDTFPIDLSISDVKERFHNRNKISVDITGKSIPLEIAGPFVPQIENLKGTANAELKFTGYAPDNFSFNGYLDILNSSFLVTPNNMRYYGDGRLELFSDSVVIKNFNLYNTREDLVDGQFQIQGKINLLDYQINDFDLYFNTKRFKVLNRGSIKNMPTLYGDFIISTSPNPLRLYGTMKTPTLSGDINVFGRSELFMPLTTTNVQSSMTAVRYEFLHNPGVSRDTLKQESTKQEKEEIKSDEQRTTEKEVGFADLLNYDIYLRILEPFTVTMELNQLGQVFAIIGTPDRFVPLHYEVSREDRIPKLSGSQLVLKEGSRLKYFKIFETSGNIFFPTGSIDDPGIDLTAVYKGYSMKDNRSRPFEVIMKITGTKNKPAIKFDYVLDGNPAVGDSSIVSQDALFLLVMGKTKAEFESGSQKGIFDFGELGSSGLSSYISKLTTELLQGTGVIQNAEINFASGSFELDKAELRLSGQLFGNVTWRVGGTIADIAANNEFSIDIPLNFFQQTDILNNIAIQLTRATNLNQTISRNQKEWEVKIKFGGSF
ncbi:MAG: hypothetical protein N2319_09455 [Candidatus Kapabacteria bacterium]|nr:hypothetical protein [Candidatus Kapabacteria bacterium]